MRDQKNLISNFFIFIAFFVVLISPLKVLSADYVPLAPIDGLTSGSAVNTGSAPKSLPAYLRTLYIFAIGAAVALAIIMVIWGGIEYMMSGSGEGKSGGKERISSALLGLLLALGSYIILSTINKDLLNLDFNITELKVSGTSIKDTNLTYVNTGTSANGGGYVVNADGTVSQNGQVINGYHADANGNIYDGTDQPVKNANGTNATAQTTGGGVSGNGSIATNSRAGLTFPTNNSNGLPSDLNSYTVQQIKQSGLLNLSPSDAAKYFPDGQPTAQGYANILASIAKSESNFNPTDNLNHRQGTDVGNTYSVGLYSLSAGDAAVRNLGYSESDLGNAYKSTDAAIQILKTQITNSGSITGGAGTGSTGHYWGPLYRGE